MNAKPVPLHCQSPAKYFSSFSFGFGPGGASAARADEAAKARTMMGKRIRFMQSLLSVVRSLARIHVADALAYLTRCTTEQTRSLSREQSHDSLTAARAPARHRMTRNISAVRAASTAITPTVKLNFWLTLQLG